MLGFTTDTFMHDDVNDVGRNLEYAAGGVIWSTPLLLYILLFRQLSELIS